MCQINKKHSTVMEYIKTAIEGVWIIEPKVFKDARGYFFEAWKQQEFDDHIGHHVEFVQDNESKSSYGVLRGLHYQKGDYSQAKLEDILGLDGPLDSDGGIVPGEARARHTRHGGRCGRGHPAQLAHLRTVCGSRTERGQQAPAFHPARIRPWIRCPERGGRLHLQGGQQLCSPAGSQHPLGRSHHRYPVAHRAQGCPHVGEGPSRQESAGS